MSKKFATNLKNARKNKCYSQQGLAAKLNIEEGNTISKWENGVQEPNLATLEMLSSVLGVSLDELVKGNIYPDHNLKEKCKDFPQLKFNNILYVKDLPRCEIDMSLNSELFYDYYEQDEENVFIQYLMDFGAAFHLEDINSKINDTEICDKIITLYKEAWADGEGLYEAGINLLRAYLISDLEEMKKGNRTIHSYDAVVLSQDLIKHNCLICGYDEIVYFYRAVLMMYGLYLIPSASFEDKGEYKAYVKNMVYDGYKDMCILAEKEYNLYAKNLLDNIKNRLAKSAKEDLEDVTAYDYWNKGHELSEEDKEWLEYLEYVSEMYDGIEEEMFKMDSMSS